MSDVKIRANRDPYSDRVSLAVLDETFGKVYVAAPLVMRELPAGEYVEPAIRLSNQAAQLLMDELWQCGLRPSEGSGSAGALAATERHLEDMRQLALASVRRGRK